jgi:hypothetical protein
MTEHPSLPQCDHDRAGLARELAAAPLKPSKAQAPCDVGLFSDDSAQADLLDLVHATQNQF